MIANWEKAFNAVLKHEGGWSNHPLDPGAMTNLGVTKKAWEAYIEKLVDEAEMRALTPEIVKPFYKRQYWDKCRCDDLPSGVDYAVYDLAVNSGVGRASKMLQQAVGATADGMIGKGTLAAVAQHAPDHVVKLISNARLDFLQRLSTFPTFGKGWSRRVNEVQVAASELARSGVA